MMMTMMMMIFGRSSLLPLNFYCHSDSYLSDGIRSAYRQKYISNWILGVARNVRNLTQNYDREIHEEYFIHDRPTPFPRPHHLQPRAHYDYRTAIGRVSYIIYVSMRHYVLTTSGDIVVCFHTAVCLSC